MDNNRKKQDKKGKSGGLVAIFFVAIGILSNILESGEAGMAIAILFVIGIALAIFAFAFRIAKKNKAAAQPVHSHDRLTVSPSVLAADRSGGAEHWKKQLDGFLAAGIIDRAEYNVLWDKYKKNWSNIDFQ